MRFQRPSVKQELFIKPLVEAGFTPVIGLRSRKLRTSGYSLILEHIDRLQMAAVVFIEIGEKEIHLDRTTTSISSKRSDYYFFNHQ